MGGAAGPAVAGGLASPFDYTVLGGAFGAVIERRFYGFSGEGPVRQRFPYQVDRDVHGHAVFSPNLELNSPTGLAAIEVTARELRLVRDALAVVFLPIATPPSAVHQIVGALRKQGYRFTDLRDRVVVEIRTDERAIVSRGGTVRLHVTGRGVVQQYDVDRTGRRLGTRATWITEPQRIEETPVLPPRILRVMEIRPVVRLTVAAISLSSAVIVIVLAGAHMLAKLAGSR